MPKRKYKKFLEPNSTIKIPCPRLESRPLHDDCKDPHAADVETRSPSGHPDHEVDPDDMADLLLSSPGRCLRTSVMQPSDLAQQFGCESTEDPPQDDPFRQIGSDTDMDCLLISAGTTTKAEALLMVMSQQGII